MSILIFNAGSTTLKFSFYHCENSNFPMDTVPIEQGIVDYKDKQYQLALGDNNYRLKAETLPQAVFEAKEYFNFGDVQAVGHRVVHGGDFFKEPTVLGSEQVKKIEQLSSLAPLHNPMNVEGIRIAEKMFPKATQVAVFDTSFHSHMPEQSRVYPIPIHWYEKGIKRYGFHGINHQYCLERLEHLLEANLSEKKIITCHLGGGCSLAAIANGHSIDTTMGFTPMEGLMMATRSGSVDPGVLFHLVETENILFDSLKSCLNDASGLKGICGTSDMREVLKAKNLGNANAILAIDLFVHNLVKGIGSMVASLQGIDCLVFSGGIGENAAEIRERACKALAFLGVDISSKTNVLCQQDEKISNHKSKVAVFRIKANEEWLIAKETLKLIAK